MRRADDCFSAEDRQRVNRTVGQAEAKTSAEIVPVVVTASGRYDRAEDVVGLWCGTAAVIGAWFLVPATEEAPGTWGGIPPEVRLVAMVLALVFGFLIGATVASRAGWLRRLFTARAEMLDEVQARARSAFFDCRVHRTGGGTGLLVYVSLYERMATVIADDTVLDKLGNAALDDLCHGLTGDLRHGNLADALCLTITAAGDRLGAVLPRTSGDANELPDALVTMD